MFAQNSDEGQEFHSSENSGSRDKRYLPRWEVNNKTLYKLSNQAQAKESRSMDISCAGMCLFTKESLANEQKVALTVYLSEDTSIKVNGKVVWNREYESGNLSGIVFLDTTPEVQELILDHAFEIKREDVLKHWFKGWGKSSDETQGK